MNEDLSRWEKIAASWSQSAHREFRPYLIIPAIQTLCGDLQGKKVLDAGCGDGAYCKFLQDSGAKAVGIDGSQTMIELARQNNPNSEFVVGDLLSKLPFEDSAFDHVFSILVLMSLSDIETFLSEAYRVLGEQGSLIIAVKHPSFSDPTMKLYKTWWQKLLMRKPKGLAEDYFVQNTGRNWESNPSARMLPYYHRTLETYVTAFRKIGFKIDAILEPHELPKEYLQKHPKLEYALRLPRFMIFKLTK